MMISYRRDFERKIESALAVREFANAHALVDGLERRERLEEKRGKPYLLSEFRNPYAGWDGGQYPQERDPMLFRVRAMQDRRVASHAAHWLRKTVGDERDLRSIVKRFARLYSVPARVPGQVGSIGARVDRRGTEWWVRVQRLPDGRLCPQDLLFGAACMAHVGIGSPYAWSARKTMQAVSRALSLNIEVP